ncbi:hypothetical protein ACFYRJ_17230 [Streptomyces sp. NPDC005531]|uniref:hypothetical protein n=1 Tax=Streptomyces sp. NPDC005531 TaxID=3364722 RepID=UPI0036BA34F3
MAIDIPEDLIELERVAVAEQRKAHGKPYTPEDWEPWRRAAEKFQAALTAHAEATGVSRYELEMAVKKAVLHPEAEEN